MFQSLFFGKDDRISWKIVRGFSFNKHFYLEAIRQTIRYINNQNYNE